MYSDAIYSAHHALAYAVHLAGATGAWLVRLHSLIPVLMLVLFAAD